MKTSTKVTGLTLAGLTTAGAAIAVIGTGSSTTVARNVSQSRHLTGANSGEAASRSSDTSRHRQRPTTVTLASRYAVTNVRAGHSVAVLRKIGHRWRVVGALRSTDRSVRGATVAVRRPTTLIAVVGRNALSLVVPPRAVVVVADNGRIGVVGWRFLKKVKVTTPTPTAAPTTATPTPAPSGSQSPVVGGLRNRVSTKW
ncbi:hypothetical protein GCM10023196_021580 [Actinoallomurus vinaceus]|uniref:Uncharacterized protein n=1 Tax=Actinoallomurus vinaceus TaxID=1080074 RepID=A0ABP8U6L6_9ACTN